MKAPSLLMLLIAVGAGAAAVFAVAMYAYTPAVQLVSEKWTEYRRWLDTELRALYSPLRSRDFAIRHGLLIAGGLFSGGLLLDSWTVGLVLAAFLAYAPVLWLDRERAKRKKALNEQLDSTLQSMANTILVTQNLEDAFATIAQHFDPPMSQEADIVVKQVRLGTPMDEALREFAARCQSRNVDAIVTALTVGRQTGGELPRVLENTANVLRETMRVEGVMEAKTSEGKAQVVLMGGLPAFFTVMLQIIDPEWMRPLFHDPVGWAVLGFACLMWGVGLLLVRKVTRIDV